MTNLGGTALETVPNFVGFLASLIEKEDVETLAGYVILGHLVTMTENCGESIEMITKAFAAGQGVLLRIQAFGVGISGN